MSRKQDFPPDNSGKENFAHALFGKRATDTQMQKIFSFAALWPSEKDLTNRLGNYAQVVRWTAKRNGRQQRFIEARFHPAIEAVLDILVPALCKRDATPFRLFADAIERTSASHVVAHHALKLACELTGHAQPFNSTFEPLSDEHGELCEPGDLKPLPDFASGFNLPVSQAEFRKSVKARSNQKEIDPANFLRLCRALKITFAKDPRKGGRKPKH